jgi:hypothetical protein
MKVTNYTMILEIRRDVDVSKVTYKNVVSFSSHEAIEK